MRHTFHKAERIKSRKTIEKLFSGGNRLVEYPVMLVYATAPRPGAYRLQATFSVSKKKFKKAVIRNRIKRLMREAFRLHKSRYQTRYENTGETTALMFIYIGKEIPGYREVEEAVARLLKKLSGT